MIILIGLLYFKTAWNASVVKVPVYSNIIALAFFNSGIYICNCSMHCTYLSRLATIKGAVFIEVNKLWYRMFNFDSVPE